MPPAEAHRWEKAIQQFEESDRETPPPQGAVLFLGSSSIRMWKLERSFPGLAALNRGFGGSTIADVNHFFDRLVPPCAPKTIVFYSGDNDIASGKAPEDVVADFKQFRERLAKALPETRLIVLPIKPSTARWALFGKMRTVNEAIARLAEDDPKLTVIDCNGAMLGDDGKPRRDYLLRDGLHMNEAGYAVWNTRLRPLLMPEETAKEK